MRYLGKYISWSFVILFFSFIFPFFIIIQPTRKAVMVRGLINIYQHEGYLPLTVRAAVWCSPQRPALLMDRKRFHRGA